MLSWWVHRGTYCISINKSLEGNFPSITCCGENSRMTSPCTGSSGFSYGQLPHMSLLEPSPGLTWLDVLGSAWLQPASSFHIITAHLSLRERAIKRRTPFSLSIPSACGKGLPSNEGSPWALLWVSEWMGESQVLSTVAVHRLQVNHKTTW